MGENQTISDHNVTKSNIDIETIVNNQETIIGLLGKLLKNRHEVVIIEEMSREEAKQKIEEYFANTDGDVYYDELMEKLHIDLELVVKLCEELKSDGKIEVG